MATARDVFLFFYSNLCLTSNLPVATSEEYTTEKPPWRFTVFTLVRLIFSLKLCVVDCYNYSTKTVNKNGKD